MSPRLLTWPVLLPVLLLALLAPWSGAARADAGHPVAQALTQRAARAAAAAQEDANEGRVIVQYRRGAALLAASPRQPLHAARLGQRLALPLSDGRALGERMQSLRGKGLSSSALAARLAAQADVEWAVVDGRKSIAAVPDDPYFGNGQTSVTPVAGQWFLRAPDSTLVSATNAVGAWDITTGSARITVAVLDTGVRFDHPDLASKLYPGYDFVRSAIENDSSGGTDADASDPGDAIGCSTSSKSSWHGTQVAGLIAAASNNGLGVAGLGRDVMVLPVRVLGQCGSGYDSDIIAGMRWAAGLSNDASCTSASNRSATCNPNPAKVLNLSLGGSGSCSSSYQSTVTELVNAGVVVVVAAGNDTGHAVNSPANCNGAIAVAGVRHAGTKVGYSNLGPQIALAAPAGNCINITEGSECLYPLMTTTNLGTTAPGSNGYSSSFGNPSLGTSFAAPLVAGTAALMRSLAPSMTPAQVKTALLTSARAFPTTGGTDSTVAACRAPSGADQLECYCTTSTCGAGMLDTAAAVTQAQAFASPPMAAVSVSVARPTAGQSVTLEGGASTASNGRSIARYAWAISSDSTQSSFTSTTSGPTATLATGIAGSVTVTLTVTDSAGLTASASQTITVLPAPVVTISFTSATPTNGDVLTLDSGTSTAGTGATITSRTWSLASGSAAATLTVSADGTTAQLVTTAAGTVTVNLVVTDSAGASTTKTQVFTVQAVPVAAISLPTGDSPTAGASVTLSSADSTVGAGRSIASRQWSITKSATQASFSGDTTGLTSTLVTAGAGSVTVSLKIIDSGGAVSTVQKVINVVAAPMAAIGASTTVPAVGSSVALDSTSSTAGAGRTLSRRQWSLLSGGAYANFSSATDGLTASLSATSVGPVTIGLTVVDSAGASHTSALAINVSAAAVVVPAVAPTAAITASTASPSVGGTVILDSASSIAGTGKTIVGRLWSITSGGSLASLTSGSTGVTAELAVTAPGSVTVGLIVTDSAGLSSTTTQTISVAAAPTATISSVSSTSAVGSSVTLDGSASAVAAGRTVASRRWSITSGGSYANLAGATDGATATLVATAVGTVTVSLTVTDSAGAASTTTQVLDVQAAPASTPGATTPDTSTPGNASGSGGGALGLGWLVGLAAAVLALGRRPRTVPVLTRG